MEAIQLPMNLKLIQLVNKYMFFLGSQIEYGTRADAAFADISDDLFGETLHGKCYRMPEYCSK